MAIIYSVLDQSPISEGSSPQEALKQTALLAQQAEEWGYRRFWVSEHHDAPTLAGSSPEVLIAHLGAVTKTIRLGSGGVMLPHYAAFKIAENFKLLEALYPGRIDAGVGRAPGGMPRASYALNEGKKRDTSQFPAQIDDLRMYLTDSIPEEHPYYGMKATPITEHSPPIWILGSSESSALLAAEKGLPYLFGHFINGEGGQHFAKEYRERFMPYKKSKPHIGFAIFVVCQETQEQAEWVASSMDLLLSMGAQGMPSKGTPPPDRAIAYPYSRFEKLLVAENRRRMVVGTPEEVVDRLEELAAEYEADEVMLVSSAYDFNAKLKTFQLIAEEMQKRE
ncbi:luciferase family oxidoreductase, group 1 [Planococcus antarcticus DSM 14505]|uniref:Luciferase family oxidoreductase, group 1 n=1 Tax=Planococcus antarcticus DSM 14505 TaxID=1185653 RepID=A0AA87IIA0_9BACL|nr:LLM class flavin-dependent oxidoreductase [Planococcus antarcticus]EIM05403.1 luciferase family oxidoreductase, group 1 [Planococcus antarcticus DSM 14505]